MEYTLKKGEATATAVELGAEMTSFKVNGKDYLWTGDPAFWGGHSPVLFPFVSRLKNDRVLFGGKTYTMKKHGFARKEKFTLVSSGEDRIEFELCDNEETRGMFPFRFSLKVAHTLFEDGFQTEYTVTNTGEGDMVFCIGAHPAFTCPLNEGESFGDYRVVFEKPENPNAIYTDPESILHRNFVKKLRFSDPLTLPLCYDYFDDDSFIIEKAESRSLSLLNGDRGINFSWHGLPALVMWTPPRKNAPFICFEPWAGLPAFDDETGNFEDKPYAVTLPEGDEYKAGFTVKIV